MTDLPTILSYGGGRQTVAMCILVGRGVIPRPDRIVMADTGREVETTFAYLDRHIRPYLTALGLDVEVAAHDLSTVDLYALNGDLLLPVFTENGKMPTFCSNEWKARVVERYLRAQGIKRATKWIGFSLDEKRRVKAVGSAEWPRAYPLLDLMLTAEDCATVIAREGWPLPPKSRCFMCPNQSNAEWRQLRDDAPAQFAEAIQLDADVRAMDDRGGVFLHQSRVALADADLDAPDRRDDLGRPCGLGMCFV